MKKLLLFLTFNLLILNSAFGQEIFVLDDGNARLYKALAANPHNADTLKSTIGRVGGMVIDNNNGGEIYYTTGSNSASSGSIIRVNKDGTNETTVVGGLSFPTGLTLDVTTGTLFFVQTISNVPSIYSIDKAGNTLPQSVVTGTVGTGPINLSVDELSQRIYWTDSRNNSIRRAAYTGLSEELVADALSGTLSGIVVDSLNDRVYWMESTLNQIRYVSMAGPFPAAPLVAVTSNLIGLGGMDYNTSTTPVTLYFTNQNSLVASAPVDGTATTILDINDGAAQPVDLAISFSSGGATPTPTVVPGSGVLTPGTQITVPPAVAVTGKKATVTLLNFSSAANTSPALTFARAAKEQKLVVRYDVKVTAPKKSDSKKLLSKKNTLTLNNLKPGNYSVNYSAIAYTKKSKTQIDKAKASGKTGFTDTYKKVFSTNISPSAGFTIN